MLRVLVEGSLVIGDAVKFEAIQVGDELIHLFVPYDENEPVKLWWGVAEILSELDGTGIKTWDTSLLEEYDSDQIKNDGFSLVKEINSRDYNVPLVANFQVAGDRNFIYLKRK